MSDAEYKKWLKKHGDEPLPEWIDMILQEDNPSIEFCTNAYNNKHIKQDNNNTRK